MEIYGSLFGSCRARNINLLKNTHSFSIYNKTLNIIKIKKKSSIFTTSNFFTGFLFTWNCLLNKNNLCLKEQSIV